MGPESVKCNTVVLKVASRCNLNCSYCYMYNLGDKTYLNQPKTMTPAVIDALLNRVKEHCLAHGIKAFHFVFHGGEPLLAGKNFYKRFVNVCNGKLLPDVKPNYVLQTNGVLLTEEWCDLFGELQIAIGVSLDGTREANDRYRLDHKGRSSFSRVVDGLKIAQNCKTKKGPPGILAVVNTEFDPSEVYEFFKGLDISHIDFLLPDANYERPSPARHHPSLSAETPYGDWLIGIFEKWFNDKSDRRPKIRTLNLIVHGILGKNISADDLGIQKNEVLVIETDGGIEAVDSLKMCGHAFTKAGANVMSHSFDEAMQTPLAKLYHFSHQRLCSQCNACPINSICGGGFIAHRFSKLKGFNNPTIYCKDMMRIISHIQNRIVELLPEKLLLEADLVPLIYHEIDHIIKASPALAAEPGYAYELEEYGRK